MSEFDQKGLDDGMLHWSYNIPRRGDYDEEGAPTSVVQDESTELVNYALPPGPIFETDWRGEGVTCACPAPALLCSWIGASKSKCGFGEFSPPSSPPKKYLTKTQSYYREENDTACIRPDPGTTSCGDTTCHYWISWGRTDSYTIDETGVCTANPPVCSSTCHRDARFHPVLGFLCGPANDDTRTDCAFAFCPNCVGGADCGVVTTSPTNQHCEATNTSGHNGCGDPTSMFSMSDVTLSDEYTTASLIANTVAALPAYADCFNCTSHTTDPACTNLISGQGCSCTAFRNLSTNEMSYTISRFKYKFRFKGSPTLYYKILWNETFKPTLSAAVTYCGSTHAAGTEDPDPSHWTVIARTYEKTFTSKCQKPESAPTSPLGAATEFDSDIYTVNEPSTNGTIYITDIRWSVVGGGSPYNPTPSSIQGVDTFSGSGTTYVCNSRTAAQRNCTPLTG